MLLATLLLAAPAQALPPEAPVQPCKMADRHGKRIEVDKRLCRPEVAKAIEAAMLPRAVLELDVSETGKVDGCRVVRASDKPAMDVKACGIMRERGRYKPATAPDGTPIRSTTRMKFRWDTDG